MWHVSSRSGVATLRTAIHLLLTCYLLCRLCSAGFPKQTAAQTVLRAINNYFKSVMTSALRQVYFVLYDMDSINVYTSELGKLDT